jgi:hypothetical protein
MYTEKLCHACGEVKPLSEFHTRKDSPDGHRNTCKDCINARLRMARWKKAHPVELVRVEPPKELHDALGTHHHYGSEPAPKPKSTIECILAEIRRRVGL